MNDRNPRELYRAWHREWRSNDGYTPPPQFFRAGRLTCVMYAASAIRVGMAFDRLTMAAHESYGAARLPGLTPERLAELKAAIRSNLRAAASMPAPVLP